jgi:polysaccharide biosynthesis transport protein
MLNRAPITHTFQNSEDEQGFDLREGIGFIWRQWKFISAILLATVFAVAVYTFTLTPRYTATAQVLLEPQREKAPGQEAILTDVNLDYAIVESQLAILRSTVFLTRVAEKANLGADPDFGGSVERAVQVLKGSVGASRAGQGYVLAISATSTDPVKAAKIANAVADAYVVEKLDARFEAAKRASAWLSDRLVELRKQLRESEEAVAKFRADNGLIQSSGNANVTLNQQQLADLNAKLVGARADLAEKEARVNLLRTIEEKGGNLQSLPDLPDSSSLNNLRQQEVAISQKEADLLTRYNDRHPLVANIRAEHRDIRRAIAAEIERLGAHIRNDYELAKARAQAVDRTFREATGQIDLDSRTAITLRELERTAAVNKSLFEDFLQRAKITQEQATFEARDSRVISPAVAPGAPSYPRTTQNITLAFIFGLFLGVGAAVARDKLHGGFATPRQVEELLELPLLCSVNVMQNSDLTIKDRVVSMPHYASLMPLSRFSEAVRTLRSGIKMTDVDNPPKVIQVTSTVPNEGKTTVALSLAASAATAGGKVLFIDADLRHTSASRFFAMQKQAGLVDILLGTVKPEEAIKYDESLKVWVLPAGTKTRNPADLIASERMKSFMALFKQSFDMVVIDTPPLGPVIDSLVFAQLADKIVYLVRWAATARELVKHSIQRLPSEKMAGVVFNMVNERAAQKYGKYAYHYYHSAKTYKKYYDERVSEVSGAKG